MKVKYVKFTALELHYFTCWSKMIQADRTLSGLDEKNAAEWEFADRAEHRLIPPIHESDIAEVLTVSQDTDCEHVNEK